MTIHWKAVGQYTRCLFFNVTLDVILDNLLINFGLGTVRSKTVNIFQIRRQGIAEALARIDDSSETVVNSLKEYLLMYTTLKSILSKVRIFLNIYKICQYQFKTLSL